MKISNSGIIISLIKKQVDQANYETKKEYEACILSSLNSAGNVYVKTMLIFPSS